MVSHFINFTAQKALKRRNQISFLNLSNIILFFQLPCSCEYYCFTENKQEYLLPRYLTSKIFNMKSFLFFQFKWFTQQLKKWKQTKRCISSTIKHSNKGTMFKALSKDTVFPTLITTFSFSMVKFIVGEKIREEKVWKRKKNSSINDYLSNCVLDIFFLSGFPFTNIHDSQDSRERESLLL